MITRNLLLAGAAAACLAWAAGCGGGGPTDEEAIKESVAGYFDGFAAADGEEACSHLTESAAEAMTGGLEGLPTVDSSSCESVIEGIAELSKESDGPPASGEVTSVEVDGETGTAYLEAEGTQVEMVKKDGEWFMDSGFTR